MAARLPRGLSTSNKVCLTEERQPPTDWIVTESRPQKFKRANARIAVLASAALALFLLTAGTCDSRMDEVDLETQQWQYLLTQLPHNVRTRCEFSMTVALNCATSAGTISVKVNGSTLPLAATTFYVGYHQTIYGVTVAANTATAICDALIATPGYPIAGKTNSDGIRICQHDCEKAAWQRLSDRGQCTSSGYLGLTTTTGSASSQTTILALTNDLDFKACAKSCLETGTLLAQ